MYLTINCLEDNTPSPGPGGPGGPAVPYKVTNKIDHKSCVIGTS